MIRERQPVKASYCLALSATSESEPVTTPAPVEPVLALPHSSRVCRKTGSDTGIKFALIKVMRIHSVHVGLTFREG